MNEILILPAALPLILWLLPLYHAILSRSRGCLVEIAVLLALAMALPLAIGIASDAAYGLASGFRLNDILLILTMQLILWLAAMLVSVFFRLRSGN